MKTQTLGRSDLRLSAIGLGCMGMSFGYGPSDQGEARATLARAVELGVTHFDTAEVYGPYDNERLLAEVLRPHRGRVTVATKVGFRFDGPGIGAERITGVDGRPEALRAAVHGSLQRLGVETIDLLYLHRVDPAVPVEDSVGALAELVREGKARYLGLSEVSAATLERAHRVHPITAVQSEYSLWVRDVEAEVLPACRRLGVGLVPYSPLGRGFLTGTLSAESQLAADDFRRTIPRLKGEALARNHELLVPALKRLADELGATPAQLALAWLLSRGDDIFPIPGARRRAHLEDNVGAAGIALDEATRRALEAAVPEQAVLQPRYAEREMALVNA
jgi:aryl-alcohol dehydrogenase-like predicted oxidoreductase